MSACILSTKGRNEAGYARVKINGTVYLHHRVVYSEHYGIPLDAMRGLVVMHTCDNPACVNPKHLVLGTHAENVADRVAKGRTRQGESHPVAKLTEADVRAIRAAARDGNKELAVRYGVNEQCISKIRNFKSWKHVK